MKLSMTKKHVTKRSWMPRLRNAILCLALLVPLSLYYGCSSDNDDNDKGGDIINPPTDTSKPHSVKISENNSNLPSGGTITSQYSDSPAGCDVSRLVDNNATTCYSTPHSKFYISWNGANAATVTYYAIVSAADTPEKDPKSWNLFASSDDKTWVALDRRTDQTFSKRGEKKEFYFENKTAYKYFKLEVLSNNGDAATQIAELYILKKDAPQDLNPEDPYTAAVDAKNINMPSGGKITSQYSDFPLGSDISKVVDYDQNTLFATSHSEFYIMWEGYKSAIANFYSLTAANANPETAPKSWKLFGTNTVSPDPKNPDNWTLIDEQTDQTFIASEVKDYQIENTDKYKYYKIDVLSNNGADSTKIAEWMVQGFATDFDDLMSKSNGNTHTNSTPMGDRFANRHITTEADKVWLNDVSKDAEIPAISDLTWRAYDNVVLFPFGEPLPADINQGGIGDCSALAIFASMAYIYPDFVKTLIKDNGNKTYTVNMFDPQGKPVTVTVNSTFLSNPVKGKSSVINWGTILEKAIMKWQCIYQVKTDINGIGSEHVAPLFTGNGDSFAFSSNKLTGQQLAQVAQVCITKGKITVGGFNKDQVPVDGTTTVSGHAWTIMHSTDKTALFTMRNPWGSNRQGPASRDGVINIPDDGVIPPLIDFRIIEPGIAAKYAKGRFTPYIPPVFPSAGNELRIEHWAGLAAK